MESPLDLTFGSSLGLFLDTAADFNKHRKRINRRIRRLRHDLDIVTHDTKNYRAKEKQTKVSVEDYDRDLRFAALVLLTAERDYAYSRELKYLMEIGTERAGSYRQLMVSRLKRALHHAKRALVILANETDRYFRLEAFVYAATLQGLYSINRKQWLVSINALAIGRCGLECLVAHHEGNSAKIYLRELLDLITDPSLNLAVTLLGTVSSLDLKLIARKHCRDQEVGFLQPAVKLIAEIDPQYVTELTLADGETPTALIKSILWRDHEAQIYNEEIAFKIMKLNALTEAATASEFDDQVVNEWTALIDLHENDTINRDEDDFEVVQSRAILSTYLQYHELFAKIKRDLLFIGEVTADLLTPKLETNKTVFWLLDAIVSAVRVVKDLPGVYNDDDLNRSVGNLERYFESLKILRLADLFAFNEQYAELLKLYSHVVDSCPSDLVVYQVEFPYGVTGNQAYAQFQLELQKRLRQTHILTQFTRDLKSPSNTSTVVESTHKFPINMQLENVINIKDTLSIEPILSKPVLFDIGFNYINYALSRSAASTPAPLSAADDPKQKSGFFGMFGR